MKNVLLCDTDRTQIVCVEKNPCEPKYPQDDEINLIL